MLAAVARNPFSGQQEIANAVGLARSTVAAHITQLARKGYILGRAYVLPEANRIACLGGATIDRKYLTHGPLRFGTSNPVEGRRSFGGVARNVAENLARLGVSVSLATMVGDDENGRALIRHLQHQGVDTAGVIVAAGRSTGEYAALLGPDHELFLGIADMDIFDAITIADLERLWPHLASAAWVFADCNLPAPVLAALVARRRGARFRLAVDPVSAPKAERLPRELDGIDLLFLNTDEAEAYFNAVHGRAAATAEAAAAALRDAGAATVILTQGASGLLVDSAGCRTAIPAVPATAMDVTGAGDALIAGTLYRMLSGDDHVAAARIGALLAALTTETEATVHPQLSTHYLADSMRRIAQMAPAEI